MFQIEIKRQDSSWSLVQFSFRIALIVFACATTARADSLLPAFSYLREQQSDLLTQMAQLEQWRTKNLFERMNRYLPRRQPANASPSSGRQLATETALRMAEAEWISQTAIGQTTRAIDRGLSPSFNGRTGETKHQLSLQVRSTQTEASVHYQGFGSSSLTYNIYLQALQYEMAHSLSAHLQVSADHLSSREETRDRLLVTWSW